MNKMLRQELKKIYKQKRREDALVGRRMHECLTTWLNAPKHVELEDDKPILKSTPEAQVALQEFGELKNEKRFREDFPTFASFKKFVNKMSLTMDDLRESVNA